MVVVLNTALILAATCFTATVEAETEVSDILYGSSVLVSIKFGHL